MKKVVILTVFTCAAMAMGNNCMKMPTFADVDTDKSGMISPAEFKKHQETYMNYMRNCNTRYGMMQMPTFGEFDLNGDGYIIESELKEARAKRMSQRAKDGRMMKNAAAAPSFASIDANKDGKISPDEFQKHQEMHMQNKCGNMGQGKMVTRRNAMMNMPQFNEYDLNNDGFISESELQEARNKRMTQNAQEGKMLKNAPAAPSFSEMDINKDGKISPDEFQKHQAEQMQTPQK
ncbi:MAG: EF-hand domain-containing protein [Sulfurovaceae bacterium]|nr:EF-hand domain-containing protein [Sulfurovaceae bacterium]